MTGAAAPRALFNPVGQSTPARPRQAPGGERETLSAILDWHRATFELKCLTVSRRSGCPNWLGRRPACPCTAWCGTEPGAERWGVPHPVRLRGRPDARSLR